MSNLGAIVSPPLPRHEIDEVVQDLAHLWKELSGARIFFTGATGFFGTWMLEMLLAANRRHGLDIKVGALSRDPDAFARKQPRLAADPALRWVRGTVTDLNAALLTEGLGQTENRWEVMIHLATQADNAATLRQPQIATEVILGGTRRALEFAEATGVQRMLFTSSGSVCARVAALGELLTEDHPATSAPLDQSTAYGISGAAKRAAENLCGTFARERGLAVSIARCFTFAGPGMPIDGKFAFGNFLRDALADQPLVIQGDGTPVRSYLYATDLTRWLWTILLRGSPGRIYNVGSERAVSVLELAETIARESSGKVNVEVRGKRNPMTPLDFYVPSTARIRAELDLQERISLSDAVERTAAWLRPSVQH